jgi:hypothetical protein
LPWAIFKIAVIAEGIHARFLHGHTRGDGFGTVGQAVPPLAARGLRALAEGARSVALNRPAANGANGAATVDDEAQS